MSQLDDILAVLTGEKRFSGQKWVSYDAGGTPLTDTGGVLWRGLHGWLLLTAAIAAAALSPVVDQGGGVKPHRWRVSTSAPAVSDERSSAARITYPTTTIFATAPPVSASGRVSWKLAVPFAGAKPDQTGEVCGSAFRVLAPVGCAKPPFVHKRHVARMGVIAPFFGACTSMAGGYGYALSSVLVPDTVQNPSVEMLALLW